MYPVPGIRITSRTLWTTTNKLEAGPAAKARDNEGQMRRSHVCVFGLVATCDVPGICPAQKPPQFLNLIPMGPRKNLIPMAPRKNKSRISEIPRPGRYRTNIKLKNRKKIYTFLHYTSMRAEYYWYVPRVSYMCRNSIPLVVCSF